VQNTIIANNTAANGNNNWGIQQQTSRLLTDGGGNIQFPPKSTNNSNDFNATDSITIADPQLGPLQEINGRLVHPLLAGSAAINTGVAIAGLTTDQLGASRSDGLIDVGAFEFGGTLPTNATLTVGNDFGVGQAGNDSLLGGTSNDILGLEGNDSLTGVNAANAGSGEMAPLVGGTDADPLLAGNATTVFSTDGVISNPDQTDYAVVADFNQPEDSIVLQGEASSYQLGALGTDTSFSPTADQTTAQLIGLVPGVSPDPVIPNPD
jgi:hypothetical protein